MIESWRLHHNTERPNGSLGYKPPPPPRGLRACVRRVGGCATRTGYAARAGPEADSTNIPNGPATGGRSPRRSASAWRRSAARTAQSDGSLKSHIVVMQIAPRGAPPRRENYGPALGAGFPDTASAATRGSNFFNANSRRPAPPIRSDLICDRDRNSIDG